MQVPANSNKAKAAPPRQPLPPVDPKFLMMAAQLMHSQGRLIKPGTAPDDPDLAQSIAAAQASS